MEDVSNFLLISLMCDWTLALWECFNLVAPALIVLTHSFIPVAVVVAVAVVSMGTVFNIKIIQKYYGVLLVHSMAQNMRAGKNKFKFWFLRPVLFKFYLYKRESHDSNK